ncbi:hypothetical protein AKJ09_00186 [Labilithrix luteola]|uniref:Uncharacterized protein n=1 Tax=Labilithrix luteola TaxID=1391654 RepID=A0A0K1PJ25_9BACT|nr:hypothetical protein AKJ09_00186 [Labilithrix luteola]
MAPGADPRETRGRRVYATAGGAQGKDEASPLYGARSSSR